ncbi:MAG: hypothetical protein AAF658_03415, partial [Myxococcota bacterium]
QAKLRDTIREHMEVSDDDFNAAVQEGQKTRRGFGEVLLEWRLIDEQALRASLLTHNARHFRGLMELGPSTRALFIPQPRTYSDLLLYTLDEILRACKLRPLETHRSRLKDVLTHTPGATVAFVLNLESPHSIFIEHGLGQADELELRDALARLTLDWRSFDRRESSREIALLNSNRVLVLQRFGLQDELLAGVFAEDFSTTGLALGLGRSALRTFCESAVAVPFDP